MGVLTKFPHRARIEVKVIHEGLSFRVECGAQNRGIYPVSWVRRSLHALRLVGMTRFLEKGVNMIHTREMLEHPVITQMERYGEMGVRRNVGATTGRPRAIRESPLQEG